MRESFRRTNGHFFLLLLTALAILMPVWLVDGWVSQVSQESPLYAVLLNSISGFFQLLLTVAAYRIFILCPDEELPPA
ncbi:hypothetical protein D9M70_581060 [compost metagenome]